MAIDQRELKAKFPASSKGGVILIRIKNTNSGQLGQIKNPRTIKKSRAMLRYNGFLFYKI
jgi:hypothetical protein